MIGMGLSSHVEQLNRIVGRRYVELLELFFFTKLKKRDRVLESKTEENKN